ncbi:histidine phosphatase family protein [Candidatus Binatia bacterium]|jgi:broad specificity phosphatase PhoE|nr:histidine phosphatase family protein [Candidatus Binatia bacterium]
MQPFPGRGRIFLLRHGETDWNRDRRIMGRRPVPLSERGRAQLLALAPHLGRLGVANIFTSPLPRARSTAELIAEHLGGIPVLDDEGLTEVHYGSWEGRTFRELVQEPEFHAYWKEPVSTPCPGGGESLLEVQERMFAAMERVVAAAAGRPAIVVSHGDPLRLVVCGCLHLDVAELRRIRLDNGGLSAIELTGDWAEVKFLNMRPDLDAMLDH